MPRYRRNAPAPQDAPLRRRRSRHGHDTRGPVTGPQLPMLRNRIDLFDLTVASTADYLKGLWPDRLTGVSFEIAATPVGAVPGSGVERWRVDRVQRRVLLFRVPIQRLSRLHRNDEFHQRMLVESCVFRAVAELLDMDPWDLAPERFRHY